MKFNQEPQTLSEKARKIQLLVLDVDGVLTDGKLYFTNGGEEIKSFCTLDGHGIKMLQATGVRVGIITGRNSNIVSKRAADIGITIVIQGREDKLQALQELVVEHHIDMDSICYMGDDHPDLPAMIAVGLAFTVPGAHTDVKERAGAITEAEGGSGAVREVTDYLLRATGNYPSFD